METDKKDYRVKSKNTGVHELNPNGCNSGEHEESIELTYGDMMDLLYESENIEEEKN